MSKHVAVVLPAYNEALGLERLLWRIARALGDLEYEVLVVDDGCTDDTAAIAESLAGRIPVRVLRHAVNSGYGAGIRTGLLEGRKTADAVVTMDADDSHDPGLIPLMLQGLACGSDVIVASRFVPGGREVGVPFHRRVLSHGAAFVFGRLLSIDGIHDYTSGYRAYSSDFLDDLVSLFGEEGVVRETGFTVGVELVLKADRAGGALAEVPLVLRYDRKRSESKLRLRTTMADYARLLQRVADERSVEERTTAGAGSSPIERRARVAALLVPDMLAVFLSFAAAVFLFGGVGGIGRAATLLPGPQPSITTFALLAGLFAGAVGVCFWRSGLYAPRLFLTTLGHLKRVVESLALATALYFTVLFVLGPAVPRVHAVASAVLACGVVLMTRRLGAARGIARGTPSEDAGSRVLIYGAGETGRVLVKQVSAAPLLRGAVVGFLDDGLPPGSVVRFESRISPAGSERKVLGGLGDLSRVAAETGADELYVATPDLGGAEFETIRMEAERAGLRLSIVPRVGTSLPGRLDADYLGTVPVLRVRPFTPSRLYETSKRIMDLAIVLLITPIALPVALVTAAAVAIDGRPILFRQTRIGRHGRPFTVWKFRTMDRTCDPYAVSPRTDTDPRITRIGRLVRIAGIDELPQLINVVRGEMSLVGPRPEMPQIAAEYGEVEQQRLCVRPGITGTWQLSPDRAGAIHESLEHDLYYLRQQNLFFDVLIVVETALFALRAAGRSFSASIADLTRGRRSSHATPAPSESDAFVLVALDQRRRPDEPASWSAYIPRAASLARDCPVKVLVADMNVTRIRELSRSNGHYLSGAERVGDAAPPREIEYVEYESPDDLHDLAGNASVVVTDLDFVADRASQRGIAVVEVADGELRFRHRRETGGPHPHAERVRDVFAGPDGGLRYAQ